MNTAQATLEKLGVLKSECKRIIVGCGPQVDGIAVATLARQHGILFGPPGEAKSMLLDSWIRGMTGVQVFTWTVAQDTMPEDLNSAGSDFMSETTESEAEGQKTIRQRQWVEPIVKGMMPTSQIVLLRELFRCNSHTLNALLTAINERYWVLRGERIQMPLWSVFGDTNNLPGEDLNAFYDRFMMRFMVDRLMEKSQRLEMRRISEGLSNRDPNVMMRVDPISAAEFMEAQKLVRQVYISPRIDELIEEIIEKLYEVGIIIYGRRDARLNRVLKANAWLDGGRDEVTEADLVDMLPHCLWDDPDDRKKVRGIVLAVANPIGKIVQDLLDEAQEIRDAALSKLRSDGQPKDAMAFQRGCLEGNTKLKRLITGDNGASDFKGVAQLLETARKAGEPTRAIEEAQATIQRFQRDVFAAATN